MDNKKKIVELSEDMLDSVSGGNRFSDETLFSCKNCGVLTPVSRLVNGVCRDCENAEKRETKEGIGRRFLL